MGCDVGGQDVVLDLFERYYERVFAFSRRSLDPQSAEDVAQEVFMRLLKLPRITEMTINSSYLIKMAENLIKRRYKRQRQFDGYVERRVVERELPGRRHTGEVVSAEEVASPDRLGELTAREEQAVRLIVCRGLSYRQAADSIGAKVSEVNNWKFRGIRRLREHVEADTSRRTSGVREKPAGVPGRDAAGQRVG